jgi:hypothetical protein
MKTGKMKTSKMKTSINLKTRKMKNNYLKLGMMAAVMLSASIGFAQKTTSAAAADDFGKEGNTVLGAAGGSVKVIDNKGTIKYLQSNNGLTTFTDVTPDGGVVTTWQLGGTLTTETNITTGDQDFKITLATPPIAGIGGAPGTPATQGTFIIDGVETVTGGAALTTVDGQIADATTTGYTFLVRDEATGETRKLLASDLITGIRSDFPQTADATAPFVITVPELPVIDGTNDFKLSVYRNGVKLRFGTDFDAQAASSLNIIANATDFSIYAGDIIEVQYLK